MQILETFSGLQRYGLKNVKEIHVNVGNLGDKDFLKQNYIQQLFYDFFAPIGIECKVVEGTAKQNSFSVEGFRLARQFVIDNTPRLWNMKWGIHNSKYLHIRKLDRQLISDATYDKLIQKYTPEFNSIDSDGDPAKDWRKFLNASHIIGAPSTFTLTTLLFDGNKKLSVIPESMCDGPDKMASEHFDVIEGLMTMFPNLRWYKE